MSLLPEIKITEQRLSVLEFEDTSIPANGGSRYVRLELAAVFTVDKIKTRHSTG